MKTVGLCHHSAIYYGLQGIGMGPFTRGLKWTLEVVEVYLIGNRKRMMNSRVHSCLPSSVFRTYSLPRVLALCLPSILPCPHFGRIFGETRAEIGRKAVDLIPPPELV